MCSKTNPHSYTPEQRKVVEEFDRLIKSRLDEADDPGACEELQELNRIIEDKLSKDQ